MLPSDDCDECVPAHLRHASVASTTFSLIPFLATACLVTYLTSHTILPYLTGRTHGSPTSRTPSPNTHSRLIPIVCIATFILSATLIQSILCEISNTLDPLARRTVLDTSLIGLLLMIILVIPALQIHAIAQSCCGCASSGHGVTPSSRYRAASRAAYTLTTIVLVLWLAAFWYLPHTSLLTNSLAHKSYNESPHSHLEACLERVGIIGISLMASLAGFAAVSSIWQTFGVSARKVSEADLARKVGGLNATQSMLETKQSRLRALERKTADAEKTSEKSYLSRIVVGIKGDDTQREHKMLLTEISGLEHMASSLDASVDEMQKALYNQQRAATSFGKLADGANVGFTIYCLYRVGATSISQLRRWWQPSSDFATADPINNILALLTTHYDPALDRLAWARQISFALSGVMLLLSCNAALQTFRLFSRFAPAVMLHARDSFPLLIAQVAGTYVISSALLLRSNLPSEVGGVIADAFGLPLDSRFIESWFESWFLVAVALTAVGILVSNRVSERDEDDDLEAGKMH